MSIAAPRSLKRLGLAVVALSIAGSALIETGSVAATAVITPVSISNIPLTVAIPAHPQVLIALGNSQSMDGDLSGAIMTGSGALTFSGASNLAASSSPVDYTIPSGFTPPLSPSSAGVAPYTVVSGGVQYDNSASRLNVAKAGIASILGDFLEYADFALMDYQTSGNTLYETSVYYMSPTGENFTFTSSPGANQYVANPCYGAVVTADTTYASNCASLLDYYGVGSGILSQPDMIIGASSDDSSINDVLYWGGGVAACVTYGGPDPLNPYPPNYSLTSYEDASVFETYSHEVNTCATETGPTNAGYVPYSPQVMYAARGFGYDSGQSADPTSGGGTPAPVVPMQSSGAAPTTTSVAAAVAEFTPYLQPETNSLATTEIKAEAVQSPIAGLLKGAEAYYANTTIPSTNGCPATQYVVLVTDGLPTEDLSGHYWPPLGSASAATTGYDVWATFNTPGDGSLTGTNDQALQDTITTLQNLKAAHIETYIIGLGAGVDPTANPQAAATLTAMAVAGGTNTYFAATSPSDLTTDMQVILADILSATELTASATVNTTGLDTSSVAYQPSFDTSDTDQDWTGNLMAYPINASTGAVETSAPVWSAQTQLDTQSAGAGWNTNRVIATWDPVTSKGIPFRWTAGTPASGIATTTTLGQELETNTSDPSGQDALNYLRGDRALEIDNGGPYRSRTHILGDIVDSAPLYVGTASGPYQSSSYYAFEGTVASRQPVIYVGANDGMLHAFNATTGNEMFAYIPNGVYSNLIDLTSPYYNEEHRFYVDGSPQASDVQFSDGSWHTELVGGEQAGGSTIFALDVTNPLTITTEAALASSVLWEFSDPDMGLSYSTPAVAQTAAGASGSNIGFTVFFGNGYNSPSQRPILYAVDPQTGVIRAKIDLCAQVPSACNTSVANGLSSPVVINDIGGVSAAATTLYAGDLQGNLWRVNISDPTPSNWTVTVLFQATDPSGVPQPITTTPVVSLNPDFPRLPGVMVYFGTGQMLGIPDLSSTQVQTMYGVYDSGSNTSILTWGSPSMQSQTLSLVTGYSNLRIVNGGPITLPTQMGWYVNLTLLSGERFVTNPRIDAGAVIATTVQPSPNTCTAGDQSWLMEFNFAGGTFVAPQFSVNGGSVSSSPIANGMQLGGSGDSGVYGTAAQIMTTPCTTNCQRVKLITESNSKGSTIQTVSEKGSQQQRTSWREIR